MQRSLLEGWPLLGTLTVLLAALSAPLWVRPALATLSFFRVRRVDVRGTRYASPDEIVSRLRVDSTASVWDDVGPWEDRVKRHPSVLDVHVIRKLPGTLVVQVTENLPVALVQATGGVVTVDRNGRTLPVDPTATDVDLPVLRVRDTIALRLLGDVREALPAGATRNHGMPDSGSGDVRMATSCEARPFPAIDRAEHGLSLRARRCTLLRAGSSRQRRRAASAPLSCAGWSVTTAGPRREGSAGARADPSPIDVCRASGRMQAEMGLMKRGWTS